jgi:hypothetical protein
MHLPGLRGIGCTLALMFCIGWVPTRQPAARAHAQVRAHTHLRVEEREDDGTRQAGVRQRCVRASERSDRCNGLRLHA